jgi:hypothetical protein
MALIGSMFSVAVLNAVDVAHYAFIVTQVNSATQAGAQAALVTCDVAHVPATQNCPGLNGAVATAIHGSSLGAGVGLSGAITEGYYCLNTANALQYVSSLDAKPADCTAAGKPALSPVLYLKIQTTYAYTPLFPTLSVAGALPTPVVRTGWMRML